MTDDETKEACRLAHLIDDADKSHMVTVGYAAELARALLAVVAQRDEARGEIDRMTSRLAKSNGQRDEARDRLRVTCEQFDAIDPSKADVIATTERARVAEEIAAWLELERRCFCALEGFGLGRHDAANCPKPIDEYEDAAANIRATYCKEQTP